MATPNSNADNKSRTKTAEALSESFGYAEVGSGDKQPLVDAVFHKVARRYDLMNDLMSAGLHRAWKDAMVQRLAPPRRPAGSWRSLDVAGGTGDIAFGIIEASNRAVHTTVLDINASMLEVGRKRAEQRRLEDHVDFVEADAQQLPFGDGIFDAYTIAFGIRNVPRIDRALSEAHRVLKRGGRFLCLEFSEVEVPVLDRLYDQWSMRVIPEIGRAVTGDADPYRYLVESVRKFPAQRDFAAMISAAGFARVEWSDFTGGIAALHSGWKL
ncbi:MAG: bifunctional demethylmenaquinone methyltransferase/2-methoxy-6-polyprenyl-1,4-benzoquinol methylase UbiE [Nitratireductor sp.]|nr:bifunctional demethylmenaquinone methyltransferase/2-methoxy-6-polyprenyl-1,4-benzoquinol methylase UbiE [Nitratireductor sp.]